MVIIIYKLLQKFNININIFLRFKKLTTYYWLIEDKYRINNKDFENLINALRLFDGEDQTILSSIFRFLNIYLVNIDLDKFVNETNYDRYINVRALYRNVFFNKYSSDKYILMERLLKKYTGNEFEDYCRNLIGSFDKISSLNKKFYHLLEVNIILNNPKLYLNPLLLEFCEDYFYDCLENYYIKRK